MVLLLHSLFTACLFQIYISSIHGSSSYDGSIKETDVYTTCSSGWFTFGDMCYKVGGLNKTGGVEWEVAQQACKEEGGLLATVYSQEIQDFISAFLLVPAQSSLWIGLDDRENETDYKWLDGTPYNFTFYEPNEPSGVRRDEEDCMEMVYKTMKKHGKMGQWNDVKCNRTFPYLCQKEKVKLSSKTDYRWVFANSVSVLDPRYCKTEKGIGWRFEESCFYVIPEKKNWTEAEDHCSKEFKGHLATLDYRVNYFINYVFRDVTEDMWIGVKIKEETQQKWSSGWLVSFENWADQEKYVDGTCVLRGVNDTWLIQSCEKKLWFLCEYSSRNATPPTLKSSPENVRCPESPQGSKGWRDFGGDLCYFLDIEAKNTWYEADYKCQKRGGLLGSIQSQEDLDMWIPFVRYYAYYRLYIGLFRPSSDAKEFEWIDGSKSNFTRWSKGEPNNHNNEEQCTELMVHTMTWNDGNCFGKMGYICSAPKIPNAFNRTNENVPTKECENSISTSFLWGMIVCTAVISLLCGAVIYHYRCRDRTQRQLC